MQKIQRITGTAVPLLLDDIDTDRIIPARFLRCVSFEGLGEHAFEDDRKQDAAHPFNNPVYRQAKVLISGGNFGCGSSREHAPQSLMRWGIQAVIAESFAEIFFGNCTSLGIPAVTASRSDLDKIAAAVQANPQLEVTLDLDSLRVSYGKDSCACEMPESARGSLTTGQWDFLGQLLDNTDKIQATAASLSYMQ